MTRAASHLRLILTGGGDAPESRPLDKLFADWLGPHGRLLYLPVASSPKADRYAGHLAWVTSVFRPLGVTDIQMWTELENHAPAELDHFSGVYIGGGNTFRLLHLLRRTGFDAALRRYALPGGAVYGGSAGAIVLGADIASCERDDPNTVGLSDSRGLDLLGGHDVWCHFTPDQAERVQMWADASGRPVCALTERAGLCVEGGEVRSAGSDAALTFTPG